MNGSGADRSSAEEKLLTVAREIVGVLTGGLLAGIAWMVIAHQGFKRNWSEQDFPEALGELRGGELTDIPRLGLWTGLAIGVVLALLILPATQRVITAPWFVRAVPLAIVTFLLWGLWFSPALTGESSFPGGVFGADAGTGTLLTYAAAALGFGLVGSRVYSVCVAGDFWAPKMNDLREQGAEVLNELGLDDGPGVRPEGAASLELPEEGLEEPHKTPGT